MLFLLVKTWNQVSKVVLITLFIKVCITLLSFGACDFTDLELIRRTPNPGQ